MKKVVVSISISVAIIFFLFGISIKGIIVKQIRDERAFLTSTYSKYCYRYGEKNLKNKIYYKTVEECGKPLK